MDLIYVITWVVVSVQAAPCPDANRNLDLGVSGSMVSCAVYHTKTVELKHEKAFKQKDSAVYFLKRLKEYKPSGWMLNGDRIENVKLDSICK